MLNKLKDLGLEVYENYNLKNLSKIKIGGIAKIFIKINKKEDIINFVLFATKNNLDYKVIGNCSNILFASDFYDEVILSINEGFNNILEFDDYLLCDSGVMLPTLSLFCLNHCIKNYEFINLIPGTLGGSIKGNSGAFNKCLMDYVIYIEVIDKQGTIKRLYQEDINYSYRKTNIDKDLIIINVCLIKEYGNKNEIKNLMDQYKNHRLNNQPYNYPTLGSTFKNGENYKAYQLIKDCGLQGFTVNGAKISEKHANFIINVGNCSAKDVLLLIENIIKKVYNIYIIKLELEIEIFRSGGIVNEY